MTTYLDELKTKLAYLEQSDANADAADELRDLIALEQEATTGTTTKRATSAKRRRASRSVTKPTPEPAQPAPPNVPDPTD